MLASPDLHAFASLCTPSRIITRPLWTNTSSGYRIETALILSNSAACVAGSSSTSLGVAEYGEPVSSGQIGTSRCHSSSEIGISSTGRSSAQRASTSQSMEYQYF